MTVTSMPTKPSQNRAEGVAPRVIRPPRRGLSRWLRQGHWMTVLIALPVIVIFLYFAWGPIVSGVVLSFQGNQFASNGAWVGFDNFIYVLKDPLLGQALLNTFYFAVLGIIFGFPIPILFAVLVGELRRRRGIFTVLAYLPVVIPPVAGIILWKAFYYPDSSGLFNAILQKVGLGPFGWLQDPAMAMPSIVVYAIWSTAGGTAIIFLAAIAGVRVELYEAAELDGAGIWSRMWNVTFPQIRRVILLILLLQIIGSLQLFAEPYLFTDGGPVNSTVTIMLLIYRYAFGGAGDFGAATALSVILALLLAVISAVYLRLTRRWSED